MFGSKVGQVGALGRAGLNSGPVALYAADFTKGSMPGGMTFSRSSNATYFDSQGTLTNSPPNTPRFDYGLPPAAAPLGLLLEDPRTNYIRNPRAEGGVTGTPGTMPTNWSIAQPVSGITVNITGLGTVGGIPFMQLQIFGTGTGQYMIMLDNAAIAASAAQAWSHSIFCRLAAGALTNVSQLGFQTNDINASAAVVGTHNLSFSPTGTFLKYGQSFTTAAGTATVVPYFVFTASGAINMTLRIGIPQLEIGSFPTSPILPTAGSPAVSSRTIELNSTPFGSFVPGSITAVVQGIPEGQASGAGLILFDDGTSSNRAIIRELGTAYNAICVVSGAATANVSQGTVTPGSVVKAAAAFDPTSTRVCINGAAPATGAGNAPTSINTLRAGQTTFNSAIFNGWIKSIVVQPYSMTNAQLQAATT